MNELGPIRKAVLFDLFEQGFGVRAAARELGISKDTSSKYHREWVDQKLQQAYDLLWDGDADGCDAITAKLPDAPVREMLDAWLDDWCDDQPGRPKSKWN